MLSPCSGGPSKPSLGSLIACKPGRSTVMVLEAGQYDAGGLGLASGQVEAEEVSKLRFGGSFGLNTRLSASTRDLVEPSVTGSSPVWSEGSSTGRSPRRSLISLMLIPAQAVAPSVKPNWNAEIRSNAEPCSSPAAKSFSLSGGSRNEIIAARRSFNPSPVLRVKRGDLPSATQRMYTPARQSACCSATRVGTPLGFSVACFSRAWPYSWANTIVMAMSPYNFRSDGMSTARSQPMVLSFSQKPALTSPPVVSPQKVPPSASESQEYSPLTGSNSPSKVSG